MEYFEKEIVETINTPFFFSVTLHYNEKGLFKLNFIEKLGTKLVKHKFSDLTSQVLAYFEGKRVSFLQNFLLPELPPFTLKVLRECSKISYGQTLTYKELASKCDNENAFRAVGNALRKNPLPIIIPCHRVIGSQGDLVGFIGKEGIEIKRCLLRMEQIDI